MTQVVGLWMIDLEKKEYILSRLFKTSVIPFPTFEPKKFLADYFRLRELDEQKSFSITKIGEFFPVICISHMGVVYMVVPKVDKKFVESYEGKCFFPNTLIDLPVEEIPELSASFLFLESLIIRFTSLKSAPTMNIKNYLQMFISQSLPFGRICDTRTDNIHNLLTREFPPRVQYTSKLPSWKSHPNHPKKKQKLLLLVREYIRYYQYPLSSQKGKEQPKNTHNCSGSVLCSAEINGYSRLHLKIEGENICNVSVDHSVWASPRTLKNPSPMSIQCTPPPGTFKVCSYQIRPQKKKTPNIIRAILQLKKLNKGNVKFLLQLKVENLRFNFDYCNVSFPFEKKIAEHQLEFQVGAIVLAGEEKKYLIWKIGKKFPKQEISLKGTISFEEDGVGDGSGGGGGNTPSSASSQGGGGPTPNVGGAGATRREEERVEKSKDPFLSVGDNFFVKLNFKLLNETISNLKISEIGTNPVSKIPNVKIQREVYSNGVKIWNSLGKYKYVLDPLDNIKN